MAEDAAPAAAPDWSAITDPAVTSPLAAFHGARPDAPAWFEQAIEDRPERSTVDVQGAAIELLTWGERGRPGLLFLHGNGAHADWWSFIAPFFAKDFRVAAISWSGMGRSGWRERYTIDTFIAEALTGAEAAGLFEGKDKPIVVAHSFGGSIATSLAAKFGERLKATVILDSGARPPEKQWRGPPQRTKPNRVYDDLPEALSRFRLMPPQACPNAFIVDYIAREGLHPAPMDAKDSEGGDDAREQGWTWRFDPFIWTKMDLSGVWESGEAIARAQCRLAFVWGAQSKIMTKDVIDFSRAHAAFGTPFVEIPESEHHVLLDQPIALVSALRSLFAAWS
jgi:pimeloyl-ACP methyl ester carboxylesterase